MRKITVLLALAPLCGAALLAAARSHPAPSQITCGIHGVPARPRAQRDRNLGAGSVEPIPWQNRGTHNHVVEVLSDAP